MARKRRSGRTIKMPKLGQGKQVLHIPFGGHWPKAVDLAMPTLASLRFHPDYLDGDIFDRYADLDEWADGLAARFPDFSSYSSTGEIATDVRSFFGKKVYTLAHGTYMQLDRPLEQAYASLWQRMIVFIPTDTTTSTNRFFVCSLADTVAFTANGQGVYDLVRHVWANQYDFGNDPGDAPDVPLPPSAILGAWHTIILRGRNPGGMSRPTFGLWLDGVKQFEQQMMYATLPMPTTGMGYNDAYFAGTSGGSRASLAMWETVPGANPYHLADA